MPDEFLDNLTVGTVIKVKIHNIDKITEKVTLIPSDPKNFKKELEQANKSNIWNINVPKVNIGDTVTGTIIYKLDLGYYIQLNEGIFGLLHKKDIHSNRSFSVDEIIDLKVVGIDEEKNLLILSA